MYDKRIVISAVILGLIAVLLVNAGNSDKGIAVLQYNTPLSKGQKITRKAVKITSVPANFADMLKRVVRADEFDWIVDQAITRDVKAGDYVDMLDLPETPKPNVVGCLQRDSVAMAVQVNAETGVGGHLAPGDTVDLFTTLKQPRDAQNPTARLVTKMILQNIRICAVGDRLERGESRTNRSRRDTTPVVILELTRTQVEQFLFVKEQAVGPVTLVLRHPDAPEVTLPSINWETMSEE